MPDLNPVRERKCSQNEGKHHGGDLRSNHDVAAIEAIGRGSADGGKHEDRNLAGGPYRGQQQGGASQAITQPGLADALHPAANQGDQLPAEEELKVSMTQRSQGQLPARSGACDWSWGIRGVFLDWSS